MAELKLKIVPQQRKFINDAQVAWEEFEDALWNMCEIAGVDESTAGDMISEMKLYIEGTWENYVGIDRD